MATNRRIADRVRYGYALSLIIMCAVMTGCTSSKPPKTDDSAVAETKEEIPSGSTVIRGAGATFPSLLYKRWFSAYHSLHPDTYVKYASVGSGEGVRRFVGKGLAEGEAIDFGASDAAMTDAQIEEAGNNVVMVPTTAGCVVLAYNIPGFTGELKLSRNAYAGIFLGEITNWNDKRIAASNPGIRLPDLTIVTVVRHDSSGTTYVFTDNLNAISERWREQFGPATLVNWPGNAMRAKGNEGVAGLIENSAGSIGYVGYEFARRIGLDYATLENKEGKFVKPSEQSCSAALDNAEVPANLRVFVPDPSGMDSYPIATFSWILLRKSYGNSGTADAVRKLFQWSLQDGQKYATELGYVPLPATVAEKSQNAVNSVGSGN